MEEQLIMSTFEKAIPIVLAHEGGYVNHPSDPGGATSFGISLRFLADYPDLGDFDHDGDVDINDIKLMTREDAVEIYRTAWWDKFGYERIEDQTIATKVFDLSVNMGAKRAHILLQVALNRAFGLQIAAEGNLGPITVGAINSAVDGDGEQVLLDAYCDEAWGFYQRLVQKKPSSAVFLKGWKNRAFHLGRANELG